MACPHVNAAELQPPSPAQSVYREDCTQCFDSIDDPSGLNVCLYCFNGGCTSERNHAALHHSTSSHPLVLNIRRTRKKVKRDEPPQKMSKLSIAAETEEDRYDTKTNVICYNCGIQDVDPSSGKLPAVIDGVLKANTFARQAEVKAWEQELTPCEHTLCLEQFPSRKIDSQDLAQCAMCELKENLWLCLHCGHLGCGRAQFGGVGGNSHAVAHKGQTDHPVAVKLGSITAEGTADIYCYACDDERTDPEIAKHLAHWGINIAEREKTEKSLTEMQIEQNLKWDFAMVTEDGKELQPLFGPEYTGLKNLGNSCYLASILQCLFSLPEFKARYFLPQENPPPTPLPAEDLETQLRKVADGLISGRYSKPDTDVTASEHSPEIPTQKGLAPAMLKHLIGRGHEEFSTMRQQDAFELLLHLFKLITRSPHPPPCADPVDSFRFTMEQRLQCLSCQKVRYRTDDQDNISIPVPATRTSPTASTGDAKDEYAPVSLTTCLDTFTAPETVDLTCPSCSSKAGFTKRTLFKTFPRILAINARRFALVNWVPTKLDIPVLIPSDGHLDLAKYKSSGRATGEEELPEDAATGAGAASTSFVPNEMALAQLEAMGFPRVRAEKALHATGNTADAETAMNWLIAHLEDPDIDVPLDLSSSSGGGGGGSGGGVASQENIDTLGAMGIPAPQARKALKETGGDVTRALDWVFSHPDDQGDFGGDDQQQQGGETQDVGKKVVGSEDQAKVALKSIVCHKGASIHAGHYVAFIRKHLPPSNPTTAPVPAPITSSADPNAMASEPKHEAVSAEEEEEEAWVLFNDEKVVKAEGDVEEMKKFAYVYFFERV